MKKEKKESSFSRLMKYAGAYRTLMYLALALAAVSAILAVFPFVYLWRIVKEVLAVSPDFSQATGIVTNGWMAVAMALFSMLAYFAALLCTHKVAFRVATNIKKQAISHIKTLPIGPLESMGSGRIRKVILDSAAATETYLAHQLPDMVNAMATPVVLIVLLFAFDWKLGLLSLIPVVLAFLNMAGMMGDAMAEDMKKYQDSLEDMNNEAVEYVRGMPVVKTFGQTVFSFKRFRDSISCYSKFCMSYTKRCRKPMLLYQVCINSVFAFLTCGALFVAKNGSVSDAFLVNLIFYIIITPIVATAMTKIMFMEENNMLVEDALGRVDQLLALQPLEQKKESQIPAGYDLKLSHVSYRYPDAERDAVDDLSMEIPQGAHIALVGASGGGKSTTAALLARFFDPTKGSITLGGVDLRSLSMAQVNQKIAYVFQDNKLLKTSIRENLRLAKADASDAEMKEAFHMAQCDDILKVLPQGLDTVIGSKGTYLSGGQMQRIAIARAILKDAPIIILDEATAFADPENEALVQEAFRQMGKGKTVIMIAHRLPTVKDADTIYVMREGKIAESGSHQELVAQPDGIYSHMWQEYQESITWKVGA